MSSYDIYNGLHPALVSEEDFMKAQEIRLDRKPTAPVREEYQLMNPFSGLLFCSICGQCNSYLLRSYGIDTYGETHKTRMA